ncbi:MAG: NAD-dependent epimerase/dehydratase family protein [Anaerolineaceae bacterium]|nr:NAD-dependent epimerase/dehydratase family protein [Anaerolineaceae bacterium]
MTGQPFWNSRPTFVTGATGQLGGWLVRRLLDAGADVVCLVRDWVPQCELVRTGLLERAKAVRGDLSDLELLRRALGEYEINTVIHLAAQSIVGTANRDPVTTFETNIRGTWSLLEACRAIPTVKQVVMASTDKVYGDSDELPYHEEMPLLAVYPHDVSKACAEMIARCYAQTYALGVAVTRLPNLYGGGDLNWSRIVPGTVRSVWKGERPVIHSNGKFIRDYLYVEDAAAAHLYLAESLAEKPELRGQAFNLSSGGHLSVLELVDKIVRLMGSDLTPLVEDKAKQEIRNQYLTAQKARDILGWRPLYTIDGGLQATIDWYRTFFAGQA